MKYEHSLIINLPRERVIELFNSTENLYKWQDGLQSFEHISGTPGQVGAKSMLKYKMGKREVEMIETITHQNLPDRFHGTYEAKNVWNKIENHFSEQGDKTEWRVVSEFKFTGFMRIMAALMKGAFKKQTLTFMTKFKDFAEKEAAA